MALIEKALSEHCCGEPVQLDGPISVRDYSEIFHALIGTAEPLEAAVKRCLDPRTKVADEPEARQQFAALQRINSAFGNRNRRYRVPTPLYLLPELGTFAMSWVDGVSVTRKLRHPGVFIDGPGWLEAIGAWLGNFHQAGPLQRRRVNVDEQLNALEDLPAAALSERSLAKAIAILQKTASPLESGEVAVSWLHGDCKTDNFIACGENIYGIDISLSHENAVEYDLAQFLNNLDLLLSSPKHLHLAGMKSKLEAAFWRGYSSTGPSVSPSYLNWLRLSFALFFWHETLKGERPNIRTWILNRMFAKLVGHLSEKTTSAH